MKSPNKEQRPQSKPCNSGRSDRKSATGMSGDPKKGGHGGKFTWSGPQIFKENEDYIREYMDEKDPNYQDPLDV
ncbi:hypothetical protein AMTRI_Chr05g67700 [Amborella trichopoda]|uniref:Uncharacterized protein n=1 Tax=Amborella trichopoda TaxID=13333 RepID=U5CYG5_AMBTC|nr:hypothetical protein AMTR_s00056p00175000 [Amborella trichopoda]